MESMSPSRQSARERNSGAAASPLARGIAVPGPSRGLRDPRPGGEAVQEPRQRAAAPDHVRVAGERGVQLAEADPAIEHPARATAVDWMPVAKQVERAGLQLPGGAVGGGAGPAPHEPHVALARAEAAAVGGVERL